jgi:hypothetical protein
MRWAVEVELMAEVRIRIKYFWKSKRERNILENPRMNGRMMLKCILNK